MMDNKLNKSDAHSVEGLNMRVLLEKMVASFSGSRKRRLVTQTATSCLLLICSACGISNTDVKAVPPRIALITPAGTGELADAIRLGAEAAAKESGAELMTVEAYPSDGHVYTPDIPNSVGSQMQVKRAATDRPTMSRSAREQAQVDAAALALKQGASALLVDPLSEKALSDIIQEAQTTNSDGTIVPVIVLNDEFPVKGITSIISMDNMEAGRQAGQAMVELLEGKGHIALLGPDPVNSGLVQREQGVMEVLEQYPDIQVEPKSICNTRDGCWQTAKQLLDQPEVDVNGFIALQEPASLGAADELNRRNAADKVRIVGFGSEQQQLEQLQEGVLDHLIVQNGYSAGYLGLNQAVARLNNQQVQARVLLETKLVSTDNMFWMDNQKLLFPFVQ